MDSFPELYAAQPDEIVKPGQDFFLLKPEKVIRNTSDLGDGSLSSVILFDLSANGIMPFKMNIHFRPSRTTIDQSLTPFNPKLGYEITEEDLDVSKRIEKMKRESKRFISEVNFNKAPLWFSLGQRNKAELERVGLFDDSHGTVSRKFKPEMLSVINQLRLQITVPVRDRELKNNLYFESLPDPLAKYIGSLEFNRFYPLVTGPLAQIPSSAGINNNIPEITYGLSLYFPDDYEKLKNIECRFILLMNPKRQDIPDVFRKAFEEEDS